MEGNELINASQTLSVYTGITFEQAYYILSESKVVTKDNFSDWLRDVERIVKLDTIDG